jgi:hypothetical protein
MMAIGSNMDFAVIGHISGKDRNHTENKGWIETSELGAGECHRKVKVLAH